MHMGQRYWHGRIFPVAVGTNFVGAERELCEICMVSEHGLFYDTSQPKIGGANKWGGGGWKKI